MNFSWTYFSTFLGGMLVLYWFVFLVAVWLKTYLSEFRLGRWFENRLGLGGYFIGALAGAVTPFCSCTTVPIFSGMVDNKIRLGHAISFLIASPTLNLPALFLFYALFGGQLTLIYSLVCFFLAVLGGLLLSHSRLDQYLIEIFLINDDDAKFNFKAVNRQYADFLKSLGPMVIIAAFIATTLKGWVPSEPFLNTLAQSQFAIPAVVGFGGAVYADIALLIPIGRLFLDKGLDMGLVFAFMMAASGVGLPSILLLTRIFKKQLLGLYLLTIFILFTGAGFLISWMV